MIRATTLAVLALVQDAPAGQAQWAEAAMERPVPAEARALGHHGVVTLEGEVSSEGRIANLVVTRSSRSPILDAAALARFGNARIGQDLVAHGEKRIRLRVDFNNYDLDNMGMGYLCGQAVLDADWFDSVSPGVAVEPSGFSSYLQGTGMIVDRMAFARDQGKFEAAWRAALGFCSTHAEMPFQGVIALAGNGRLPK